MKTYRIICKPEIQGEQIVTKYYIQFRFLWIFWLYVYEYEWLREKYCSYTLEHAQKIVKKLMDEDKLNDRLKQIPTKIIEVEKQDG